MSRKAFFLLIVSGIFTHLSGCGSDGDGSSASSIAYNGNTDAAVIRLENATTLVGNVLYGGNGGTNAPIAISITDETNRSAGGIVQAELLRNVYRQIKEEVLKQSAYQPDIVVAAVIDETLDCEEGTASLTGTVNDVTATGTLTITYINCLNEGNTYDGTGTFIIDSFNFGFLIPDDVRIIFPQMSISSEEFTGTMGGTVRIQSVIDSNPVTFKERLTETMTMNIVTEDGLTDKMYQYADVVITTVFDEFFFPTSKTETYTGSPARVYDSLHGYVDVDTPTPLAYSSLTLIYPDLDGVMLFTGAADASIKITVLSAVHVQMELDIDGVSGYEVLRVLLWDDLKFNVETDISDSDSDGMHDNWEIDNGLDPLDGADASQDADGDGYSNLEEYLAGTDPNVTDP